MEILFIAATLPYPPTDGAKIRLFSLIKHLAVRHKVSVASFVTSADHPDAIEHLRSYCKEVIVVRRYSRYAFSKIIRGLVSPTPFPVLNYWDPKMASAIKRIVESTTFDIVQAETLLAAQYCTAIRRYKILDLFDIYSVVMQRYAEQQANLLKRGYAQMTARKLAQYERTICPQFTHCLVSSPNDQHALQKHVGAKHVTLIPNGVDLDLYVPQNGQNEKGNRIVFVGRMDYAPNVDGVRWFCREVLPLVKAQCVENLFQIVGKNPGTTVKRLAIPGQIEVTGFVEDIRPYLRAATVCVVPLRVASGTRLKILESLAMGKAIVSTSVGAEGLAVTPEQDLLIADDPRDFAKQIVRVLGDVGLRERLGKAGRLLVETQYGWNTIGQRLESVYERVLHESTCHQAVSSRQ
jgi:sugar transferase (PEP-CTERM/EpsH1 system associated)